jgi:ferritin-like metal-binding protein YciE
MERQAQEMLERQIERMTDYPVLRDRLSEHLGETKLHIQRLEQCLERCGSSESAIKDAALAVGANLAAMTQAMASDEVLKNTFASNALENYEIAAYRSLLIMAGDSREFKGPLEQSLQEEERMAN